MSLDHYDAPTGAYTATIPRGTQAFRMVVAEHFVYSRHEVVRDRSRCQQRRSEHCECGAIDFFTTDPLKGRVLFNWCVQNAKALGVQSVIFRDRETGFGNPRERHRRKKDHFDHVHVGLNVWARHNLSKAYVEAHLPGTGEDELTPAQEAKLDKIITDVGTVAAKLTLNLTVKGKKQLVNLEDVVLRLAQKEGLIGPDPAREWKG